MKAVYKIFMAVAAAAVLAFTGCNMTPGGSSNGKSVYSETVTGIDIYSGNLECYTNNLYYDESATAYDLYGYIGEGWVLDLKPGDGVTVGESGKYEIYVMYHYKDQKKVGAALGYVPKTTTYVDVTVTDGKASFSIPSTATNMQVGIGESDANMTISFTCSNIKID